MEPEWNEQGCVDPVQRRRELLAALYTELHDLSQPLTALVCFLEIGRISGDCDGLREAVEGGIEETRRLFASVSKMRRFLRDEEMALSAELLSPQELQRLWQREN